MRHTPKNYSTTKQAKILTALVLTSILSVGNAGVPEGATATPTKILSAKVNKSLKQNTKINRLPTSVASAIKRDLASKKQIPIKNLEIIDYSQRTWGNGCLDLPNPKELCTQAQVPGWRVVVSNGSQNWTYHTNSTGRYLRLAKQIQNNLPQSVKKAVLQTASGRLELPVDQLSVIEVQKRDWSNGCLNLPKPGEGCTQAIVPGWRIVVGAAEQRLVYHTNTNGSAIRLNQRASDIKDGSLPQRVSNVVLEAASDFTGLAISQLRIVNSQQITTDGCLNLPQPGETCTEAATRAWKVTVVGGRQTLVFHAHPNGREVRLNDTASTIPALPQSVAVAVLEKASRESGLPGSSLNIIGYKPARWAYGCEGQTYPYPCDPVPVSGWEVTVGTGQDRWVFLTDERGSRVQLSQDYGETPNVSLPRDITESILVRASRRSELPISRLRIVDVDKEQWPDSCLGIPDPLALCAAVVVPGWRVTVSDGQQVLIYRAAESGTVIFDERASTIANNNGFKPIPIPKSELPRPLDRNVVFRQIASGGIAGRTYETVLLDDGHLIRVRLGDANDSERSVHRIPLEQVRRFQKLLRQESDMFNNMSYPATRGGADYITYTLTSPKGTVQYNDISQNSLPEDLRLLVNTWVQINRVY
ncbi:hypothetical protein NUACC21_30480 [Scytonema sp. NUACC21]